MRPSDFGLCSRDEGLAVMIAYSRDTAKIMAYDAETREMELKAKRKKK